MTEGGGVAAAGRRRRRLDLAHLRRRDHRAGVDLGIAIGNELELAAGPHRGRIGELQPARQNALRRFLIAERRRESKADRLAIGLVGGIAAGAEQGRGIDARSRKADAILGIGEEVVDDLRRIGIDAIDAGSLQHPLNLEIMIGNRRRCAEIVIAAGDEGRALIAERLRRIGGAEIAPHALRRRAGKQRQAELGERIGRLVAPDLADAGDRPFAERENDRGRIVVAGRRRGEQSALAACGFGIVTLKIIVPDRIRREPCDAPDDRDRQGIGRCLDLQAGINRLLHGLGTKEAHDGRPMAEEFERAARIGQLSVEMHGLFEHQAAAARRRARSSKDRRS